MSRNYKIRNQSQLYFLSFATVFWIDVFIRRLYKDIIVKNLIFCTQNKDLELYAWCLMTNHLHLICGTRGGKLEYILRDFKKYTSKRFKEVIQENPQESKKVWMLKAFRKAGIKNPNNKDFQFWQQNNQPIKLSNRFIAKQKLDYIHNNPVVEGIVEEPNEYFYSSAKNYAGMKGLIDVILLE